MSNAVESEIVSMKFENTQFENGVKTTLSSLDRLKSSLKFSEGSTGLDNIGKNVRGFNLNPLVNSAGEVGKAFSAMSVTAISAIATVASQATNAGLGIAKSLTISPISGGFSEYETQLGSIQTILANTGLEGQKGLDQVNGALNQLNTYSDKTIYNFTEMAKNIGTFTAAGIDLDTSTAAIKGIANLAAVSGSTSEQASTAMYQLSQALASGKVSLMDWNSVVNAGLGGKVFKDALIDTAKAQGIAVDDMIAKNGSFRDSLQEGWITGEVLTKTLEKFTGDLSKKQLIQQGYTEKQANEIMKLGQMSSDAATKVKTLSQLMDTLKEAVGSGWSKTFQLLLGDFGEAKKTFTDASNALGGFVQASANHRNKVLQHWKDLNGRTVLILAVKHAWEALGSVLGPIRDAFREVFPATTAKQLKHLTAGLNRFFKALILSKDAQEDLKRTFAGLFAVLHIFTSLVGGVLHVLTTLIGLFFQSQGSTLAFTGGIGDMLVALDKFLTGGDRMKKFFDVVAQALTGILTPILAVRSALITLITGLVTADPTKIFSGFHDAISGVLGLVDNLSAGFATAINSITSAFGGLGTLKGFDLQGLFGGASKGAGASKSVDSLKTAMGSVGTVVDSIKAKYQQLLDLFGKGGDAVENGFGASITKIQAAWQSTLEFFGRAQDVLAKVFNGVGPLIQQALDSGITSISFDQVTQAINLALFYAIYKQFKNLTEAFSGFADSASGVLNQVTDNLKTMQADVKADILFRIAAALVLLSGAIFLLAQTDPKQLGVALAAVSVMLTELVVALKQLEKTTSKLTDSAQMIAVSAALVLLSVAVAAMAGAVFLFSKLSLGELSKGLLGVTASIAVLTAAAVALSKGGVGANMIGAATGLLIMSAALVAMNGAIKVFAKLDPDVLKSGLIKIAVTLGVLVVAMNLMNGSVGSAVSMAIIAGGLIILAIALQKFAAIPGDEIKKAIITIAFALGVLVIAMNAMNGGLVGAGALVIMVAALTLLIPVIIAAGQLDWETVGKGLLIIVGSMLALALAAAAISPIIPVLTALATVVLAIGAAVFLVGSGIALFATGLALLAASGKAGFGVLIDIINAFLDKLPVMLEKFGTALSALAKVIGDKAPEFIDAMTKLIIAGIDAGIKLMPKFGKFISAMIKTGLRVLVSFGSDFANAALDLLNNVINAFDAHVDDISKSATDLAIHFVNALGKESVRFANAALDALIDFLEGLADAINTHSHDINAAGIDVAKAIINGIKDGITQAAQAVADGINDMLKSALSKVNPVNVGGKILGGGKKLLGSVLPGRAAVVRALYGSYAKLVGGFQDMTSATQSQTSSALSDIKDQIDTAVSDAQGKVSDLNDQLEALQKAKKKDKKKIAQTKKAIDDNKALKKTALEAQAAFKAQMNANQANLSSLSAQYDILTKQIEDQKQVVQEATDAQKAFQDSVKATFNTKPDIQAGQSLSSYMREIAKQQTKVNHFNELINQLRSQGISDETYRTLLAEGTDANRLMEQLLAGGPQAIANFQAANATLAQTSAQIATTASSSLGYDQAVTNAQAVLDGFIHGVNGQGGLDQVVAAMNNIAQAMMNALAGKLEIHSPSRAMARLGRFAILGLINKIDAMNGDVAASAANVGNTVLDTLQATMSNAGNQAMNRVELSPVITPILDLTKLSKDASSISGLMSAQPIVAGVSFAQASNIAAGRTPTDDDFTDDGSGNTYITLEQNNTSPKSLDTATIYRNTYSQLSRAKEALGQP